MCLISADDKHKIPIGEDTAPNHSWTNPAEWIMSTLNLGFQGVALKRDSMSSESEALFDTVNTLDDIRKKAQECSELESELKKVLKIY